MGDTYAPYLPGGTQERLYESGRSAVVRVFPPHRAGSVVVKVARGADALGRMRHERSILRRLAGVAGVVQLAAAPDAPSMISLEDGDATSLERMIANGPMDVATLLELAPDLARAVGRMHRRGVIHKDITPANIVWSGTSHQLWLIDFDMAVTFAEERPAFVHQNQVTGTLAYLAPEQTGRTGHPVDQRTDLYGLGSTLYALATGAPPFGFADPLQLIHDHLARVPVAPVQRNAAIPVALSEVIMRLLEKEPDRRYQSSDGLAHDLDRVRDAWRRGESRPLVLGERDFPLRLSAPSRLVGREAEMATLNETLVAALSDRGRGVLVSGAPGVGKTRLLDHLRPMVTRRGGWFVSGKFDQYRQNQDADAMWQALGGLSRLLLAEPEAEIVAHRARLLDHLGANAGLAAALLPQLASVLDVPAGMPEGDPLAMQTRLQQVGLALLRATASPQRPVVIVIDDLQWATPATFGFVDAVMTDDHLPGVLLVGAYRQTEVDAAHPLTAMMSRWNQLGAAPRQLRLSNLPPAALGTLLAEMLRIGPAETSPLAEAIAERTDGNPYETVEFVNALRHDGALVLGAEGWQWDLALLRSYLVRGDVIDLLSARMEALPPPTVAVLETMGCLGGKVRLTLLAAACDVNGETLEEMLLPALEDGLLVVDSSEGSVGFRHDRVQQAAFDHLAGQRRAELRLTLARRIAALPAHEPYAAEQYLPVADLVEDPGERSRMVALFRTAAAHARVTADHARVERLVAAAMVASAVDGCTPDDPAVVELAVERHAALYSLGRLDEADEVYRWIIEHTTDPLEHAEATWLQTSSLTNRGQAPEAVRLGLGLLHQLGKSVPEDPGGLQAAIGAGLQELYRWCADGDAATDLRRPVCDEPRVVAMARTINRTIPAAFFCDQLTFAWLVMEAGRMWAEHGPSPALVGPLSNAAFALAVLRDDYRTGNAVVRRVLAVGEARGYEPDTSQCRFTYTLSSAAWFEPVEDVIHQARRAHEGLVRGGDLHFAGHTFYITVPDLVDCAATLDELLAEVETALAFSARTGNDQTTEAYLNYRQFVRSLRGETHERGGFGDASFNEADHVARLATNPVAAANYEVTKALTAALFGDTVGLVRHGEAIAPFMPFIHGTYLTTAAHLLQALALAETARASSGDDRDALLAQFDSHLTWLAGRAEDSPRTFRHLVGLLSAERAWVLDDQRAAAAAFDAALRQVTRQQRPWHRALIAERSALFQLDQGLEYAGHQLLREARQAYEAWGATAKVADLDQRYAGLTRQRGGDQDAFRRHTIDASSSGVFANEEIDLRGVLSTSQTLSSETNLDRLRARVVAVLGTLTGATSVRVALRDDDAQRWVLPTDDHQPICIEEAATRGMLPLSAFHYAERSREPLLVEDATRDDRFGHDPYLAGLDCCSLLVVPILTRGAPRAVLILENRLSRTAFTAERLDVVTLIAGQLAVSLDNALLYASLERKVAERTEALDAANHRLEALSATDPLTGLANRRRLEVALDDAWREALHSHDPIAFAMIDIDHFKLFNDEYGHPAGDQCLRRVAAVLSEQVRATDVVGRYGGEEFAVIMPGVDTEGAQRIARRICDAVTSLNQPHRHSPFGIVTVSLGVASTIPTSTSSAQQLVQSADDNLYRAKDRGRNRVAAR